MNNTGGPSNRDNDRDEEDEDFLNLTGAAVCAWYLYNRNIPREPRIRKHTSQLSGIIRVENLLGGHPDVIFNKVRMYARTFRTLSALLEERGLLQCTRNLNVDEQLFIFLTIIAQTQTNREAQDHWQHSGETISRCFSKVLEAICALKSDFIRPPNYARVQKFIRNNEHKYRPWFDNCVGAIDGTHIDCRPPSESREAYRNRKGLLSQNILAACSFDMRFTYILAGWEGSAHDSRVLQSTLSNPQLGFPRPPSGKYYLVDSGYANQDCFLAPYRGNTYHLQEYRERRGDITSSRELFNFTHSSLRNCIERTFGVWKARFPILKRMHPYPIEKQVMIPIACAVIHNFIYFVRENDELIRQYSVDGVPVTEIDPNNESEIDYVDLVDHMSDGPSVRGGVSRTEMGQFRDRLAEEMWSEFPQRMWYRR